MADCFINRQGGSGNSDYEFTFSADGKFQYPAKVIIPNTVTSLQSNSQQGFYNHEEIEEIIFEPYSQITKLQGFNLCKNLQRINIPKSVVSILANSFSGDNSLQTVVFDEDINDEERIITMETNSIFLNCTSLKEFSFIENSKIKIRLNNSSSNLFKNCVSLDDNSFSNIIGKMTANTYVGSNIFEGCNGLTNVVCPFVGNYLFSSCTKLEEAIISPPNLISYTPNHVFLGCSNLKKVIVDNIKGIGNYFFQNCTSLNSVTLSDDITSINSGAFQNCSSLTSLFLPSTITTFNSPNTFTGCTNLSNLSVGANWNCVADFSTLDLAIESIIEIFNNLKDLTSETTKTLTLGSNNLLKTTAEQRAIATNKNWTLA